MRRLVRRCGVASDDPRPPRSGPLIDTKTYACDGAAGSFYCRAAYEPLPKGTYRWRIRWLGRRPAHVQLTVLW